MTQRLSQTFRPVQLVLLVVTAVSVLSLRAPAGAQPADGPALQAAWLDAVNDGDVEAALEFFVADPVFEAGMTCTDMPCVGMPAVRRELETMQQQQFAAIITRSEAHRATTTTWVEFTSDRTRAAGVGRVVGAFTMELRDSRFAYGSLAVFRADPESDSYFRYVVAQQPPPPPPPAPAPTPEGRFVDLGGRSIYLECFGEGSPTVIFEGGSSATRGAATGRVWDGLNGRYPYVTILRDVARVTRACVYDPASVGLSDPRPRPSTGLADAADLQLLLHAADITPPYVLVGISYGGLVVQLFASAYPEEVAGLVLLDTVQEDVDDRLTALIESRAPQLLETRRANLRRSYEQGASPAGLAGGTDVPTTYTQVREMGPMPAVPAVVLARGTPTNPATLAPDFPAHEIDVILNELQGQVARRIPGSEFVVVDNSGHAMNVYVPGLLTETISRVVARARAGTR